MFAFAIWDARKKSLFLARDRLGKKPLFYFFGNDRFLFASEIKALLRDRTLPREPDAVAIDHFLAFGYVPGSRAAFNGIRKLPPAHWLELSDGTLRLERYWKLRYEPKRKISMADATAELDSRLAEAVRLRLVSDVPVGAFLSGGVDSSAVVAHMAAAMTQPVRTFSVGFGNAGFDERPYARQVARLYGTDHTELVVESPVADILSRLVWHYDEPFGDASAVPSFAISELTRKHVSVVLNGDGADESFAGYDWYKMDRAMQRCHILPLQARSWFANMIRHFPGSQATRGPGRKIARFAEVLALPPTRRYAQWTEHFGPCGRREIYTDGFAETVDQSEPDDLLAAAIDQGDGQEWLDKLLGADVNLYLVDDLLVKMDRATMSHSLEARSPFLDHLLMEFVGTLPAAFKQAWGRKKRLLKETLRNKLPKELLDRPKMGFTVPLADWFRKDLKDVAHDALLSRRAIGRGYFDGKAVARLLREHACGADHGIRLWDLLVLELWHRQFTDSAVLPACGELSVSCGN
jgi:asparagine synthase (glutamine-hydrolysing)